MLLLLLTGCVSLGAKPEVAAVARTLACDPSSGATMEALAKIAASADKRAANLALIAPSVIALAQSAGCAAALADSARAAQP